LGQPLAARRTQLFGMGKCRTRAAAVIVIWRRKYGLGF
jgi:hypothetical protein